MTKLDHWLLLKNGEFKSLLPFAVLYFFLFTILTLADGLSTALFLSKLGPDYIARVYVSSACLNFIFIAIYVRIVESFSSALILRVIVAALMLSYLPLPWMSTSENLLILLYPYALREVFYTLVLIHFGNFITDYFSREELVRVLPLSYSGGRLGGLLGAALLSTLPVILPVEYLSFAIAILALFSIGCMFFIDRHHTSTLTTTNNSQENGPQASNSILANFKTNPYLRYLVIMSFSFMLLRWLTQYLHFVATHQFYTSKEDIALFIGHYTLISVSLAFFFQLLLFNRLVKRVGLRVSHSIYNLLLLSCPIFAMFFFGQFWLLIWMRFIENEFRFSLRNPLTQLFINRLNSPLRRRTRAITMGLINPIGVLTASALIWLCQDQVLIVAGVAVVCGLGHLAVVHLFHRC
jgi:hypothetical protein